MGSSDYFYRNSINLRLICSIAVTIFFGEIHCKVTTFTICYERFGAVWRGLAQFGAVWCGLARFYRVVIRRKAATSQYILRVSANFTSVTCNKLVSASFYELCSKDTTFTNLVVAFCGFPLRSGEIK